MTTVYLIRHAQAEGNLYRRCQGSHNALITEKGRLQIAALEERFRDTHFDAVYSSDMYRTMATAQAICRPHNLPLVVEPDLREVGMGWWEDRSWGDTLVADRGSMAAFLRCDPNWYVDGSDTFPGVQERFCSAVERIVKAHPDQTVAIVSHGNSIRTGLARWLGHSIDEISKVTLGDNTSVSCLTFSGNGVDVIFYGDSSHLGSLAAFSPKIDDPLGNMEMHSLYFRPLDLPNQTDLYLNYRADGWMASHGTMDHFDGDAFLKTAGRNHDYDPSSIQIAYIKGQPVGMLQLDMEQEAESGVGRVPFFYIRPEFRSQGFGIQLLGQAISVYRNLGRLSIRLRCAPENSRAKTFYERHGFRKIGEEAGGIGHLDTMEKYIGFDHI